jgi:hypothetical protein
MLEIRPDAASFVIFDMTDDKAIIRCDSMREVAEQVAELTVADAHALLEVGQLPA